MIETDVATGLAAQIATMTSLLKAIALNNQGGTVGPAYSINALSSMAAVSCV